MQFRLNSQYVDTVSGKPFLDMDLVGGSSNPTNRPLYIQTANVARSIRGAGVFANPNQFFISPVYIFGNQIVNALCVILTAAGAAGAKCRIGLYTDASLYPGNLLVDTGDIDCTIVGLRQVAVNVALTEGLYWVVCAVGTAGATYRVQADTAIITELVGQTALSTLPTELLLAQAYSAMPATFFAGATESAAAKLLTLLRLQ